MMNEAKKINFPALDIMPLMMDKTKEKGITMADYFLDLNHFTVMGCEVVGKILADYMLEQELLKCD